MKRHAQPDVEAPARAPHTAFSRRGPDIGLVAGPDAVAPRIIAAGSTCPDGTQRLTSPALADPP